MKLKFWRTNNDERGRWYRQLSFPWLNGQHKGVSSCDSNTSWYVQHLPEMIKEGYKWHRKNP